MPPKENTTKCYTNFEEFMQFTAENMKAVIERLDRISEELRDIKHKMEVSELKQNHIETIENNTEIVNDFITNFKSSEYAQEFSRFTTMNDDEVEPNSVTVIDNINNSTEVNSTDGNMTNLNPNEENAIYMKDKHIQFWNQQLKFRRIAYWNMIKNSEKADIYDKWLTSGPKVIPRKFQFNEISGEPENQRVRRERLALEKFKAEIDLLHMRAKYNDDKYKSIDQKMRSFFTGKINGTAFQVLMFMWENECKFEEQNSTERWSKSKCWFSKYESQFEENFVNRNPFLKHRNTNVRNADNSESTNQIKTPRFQRRPYRENTQNHANNNNENDSIYRYNRIPNHERQYRRFNKYQHNETSTRNRVRNTTPRNSFLGSGANLNQHR